MDDDVKAEYQRRLDEGDKQGALQYLRMLRTQTDDSAARQAYTDAINRIENSDNPFTSSEDQYQGSSGPFGDNNTDWEAKHKHHHTATAPPAVEAGTPDTGFQAESPSASSGDNSSAYDRAHKDEVSGSAGATVGGGASVGTPAAPAPEHHTGIGAIGDFIGGIVGGHHDTKPTPAAPTTPAPAHKGPDIGDTIGNLIGGAVGGGLGLGGQVGGAIGDRVQHAIDNVTGHGHDHDAPKTTKTSAHMDDDEEGGSGSSVV
jgi:hypothetical protein